MTTSALTLLTLSLLLAQQASAEIVLPATELVLPDRREVVEQGEALPSAEFDIAYIGGTVMLSGDGSSGAAFWVDDHLLLEITRPDGTLARWERNFTPDCYKDVASTPEDVTSFFQPGMNRVRVTISDVCGAYVGPLSKLMISGVLVTQHKEARFPWIVPAVLLGAPLVLVVAGRGLLIVRRRRGRALAAEGPRGRRWKPGPRPIGVVDDALIAIGSEPMNPDGTPGAPLEFTAGPVRIGWGPMCTFRVPKISGVASEHARIWLRGGRLTIYNIVPGYSTLVGGHPVIWDYLDVGDVIDIGPYRFRCIRVTEEERTRPPVAAAAVPAVSPGA